ncbi:MAG: cytochrome-c peroxidase [Bacteroidetes bacterium]|nr:MAG: cytochrome-c peroxidase [Bacteroidota bacterium]MBL1146005.1 cytochrome-c peroxidase [Bacteroidota bacterium]NOG58799.1 cytochrome-c peroxidase [Bacteroidota bacterium]
MIKTALKFSFIIIFLSCCKKDDNSDIINNQKQDDPITQTPYVLSLPQHFVYIDPPQIPVDNPLTVEGIALGKKLFFEKKLSKNNVLSCASCHKPEDAFNDKGLALSIGVDGTPGLRNAMPLFNLAFNKTFPDHGSFNWHGAKLTIEQQAFGPVTDKLEMVETWPNVVSKLQNDPAYPPLFEKAFNTPIVDSNLVVKAIAQFERTLISGNSKADNEIKKRNGIAYTGQALNAQEKRGYELFIGEGKGDCMHCHGIFPNPLWTDFEFRNNGLDANPDSGLAQVTKRASDVGKFKTPSLRNLVFTDPYMHDGRFQTLEEVVDFYASGIQSSPTIDPTMLKNRNLTPAEKVDLIAFLKAITDSTFVTNPAFRE